MKTSTTILTALAMASLATLPGCGTGEASVNDAETVQAATPVPVEVAQPYRVDIFATYDATATIASDADAPVIARVAGEVVELLVEEGDIVTAGQVLARLDGERLRLEMLAAKANLEQARKEYKRNVDLHRRGLISTSMFEGLQYDLAALEAIKILSGCGEPLWGRMLVYDGFAGVPRVMELRRDPACGVCGGGDQSSPSAET